MCILFICKQISFETISCNNLNKIVLSYWNTWLKFNLFTSWSQLENNKAMQKQRNLVLATNSDFLISISRQPYIVNIWYFKLWLLLDQIAWVWNIKGLHHQLFNWVSYKISVSISGYIQGCPQGMILQRSETTICHFISLFLILLATVNMCRFFYQIIYYVAVYNYMRDIKEI